MEDAERATADRLNWLRAGVLGANDGVVSVAAVTIGVASANPQADHVILIAGIAALIGGAASMALGEYVSVSSQRDAQRVANRGRKDRHHEVSPWIAALASAIAFLTGGIIPLLTILLVPSGYKISVGIAATILALGLAGLLSARLGNASIARPIIRVVLGGMIALTLTFVLGSLLGTGIG